MKRFGHASKMDFTDVLRGGTLSLVRNDRDKPFGTEDRYAFTGEWLTPCELPLAYRHALSAEKSEPKKRRPRARLSPGTRGSATFRPFRRIAERD